MKGILVNIPRNIVTDGCNAHPTGLLAAKIPTNVEITKSLEMEPAGGSLAPCENLNIDPPFLINKQFPLSDNEILRYFISLKTDFGSA